jgi:parallel beta-helix repeat protein
MDGKKETVRILGAVLMMLFVGLLASQGFALNVPSQTVIGETTVATWDSEARLYTLIMDVEDNIEINEPNLILDGAGFSVINPGVGTGIGVYLNGREGVTISNLTITGFQKGVHLVSCSGCILAQNIIIDNVSYGVYLDTSSGNELIGNTVTGSSYGIYLYKSNENNIEANAVNSNTDGIRLDDYCNLNTVTDNTIEGNVLNGIVLDFICDDNEVTYNTISNNKEGIVLYRGHSNDLTDNLIMSNSSSGIRLNLCSTNIITHNVISDHNEDYAKGLYVHNVSDENYIYNNSFIDNNIQAEENSIGTNIFYLEPPIGGNYWSDLTGPDTNGDGFVDVPWTGMGITDNYPLVNAYVVPISRQITSFYDTCVDDGTIVATTDKTKPAEKRLTQFRDILIGAQALIEVGDYTSACEKLDDALAAFDGITPPPDKITGDSIDELEVMILDLKALLGC